MLKKNVHPLCVAAAFALALSAEGYSFVRMIDVKKTTVAISPKLMESYMRQRQDQMYATLERIPSEMVHRAIFRENTQNRNRRP